MQQLYSNEVEHPRIYPEHKSSYWKCRSCSRVSCGASSLCRPRFTKPCGIHTDVLKNVLDEVDVIDAQLAEILVFDSDDEEIDD